MSKANLELNNFAMAPRRKAGVDAIDRSAEPVADETVSDSDTLPKRKASVIQKMPDEDRQRLAQERAIDQENGRRALSSLKRARQRHAKFYVNVALDQATKGRLARAALENDVKMTVIMQAAIDTYLSENGY
jgi:hypothetical protein